jgi:hypothetical protein
LRKSIKQTITQLEKIDMQRAETAVKGIEQLRKLKVFAKGKSGTEIIREWRNKRRL